MYLNVFFNNFKIKSIYYQRKFYLISNVTAFSKPVIMESESVENCFKLFFLFKSLQ